MKYLLLCLCISFAFPAFGRGWVEFSISYKDDGKIDFDPYLDFNWLKNSSKSVGQLTLLRESNPCVKNLTDRLNTFIYSKNSKKILQRFYNQVDSFRVKYDLILIDKHHRDKILQQVCNMDVINLQILIHATMSPTRYPYVVVPSYIEFANQAEIDNFNETRFDNELRHVINKTLRSLGHSIELERNFIEMEGNFIELEGNSIEPLEEEGGLFQNQTLETIRQISSDDKQDNKRPKRLNLLDFFKY